MHESAISEDMQLIQQFYAGLLRDMLGQEILVPRQLSAEPCAADLRRWVDLLNLAITTQMMRERLHSPPPLLLEALLRYFASKPSGGRTDRERTDLVVSLMYRGFQAQTSAVPAEGLRLFEAALQPCLETPTPELPEEYRQLLREFPAMREEVEQFRTLEELTDGGVIQRARDIKERFGTSFWHPCVLATVADYNLFFGRHFDRLFRKAVCEINDFAARVQQQGGSILSRVDGEIRVKHLADVEADEILHQDYERAREHIQQVSLYKKAVNRSRQRHGARSDAGRIADQAKGREPENWRAEIAKVQIACDSIRTFVRAAELKACRVVPLRNGNLVLSSAEADAFRSDFAGEKSFRGECATALAKAVSLQVRMREEIDDLTHKRHLKYLWKTHADSLAYLLAAAQQVYQGSSQLAQTATERGLLDKATAIQASLEKLHSASQQATGFLQQLAAPQSSLPDTQ